MIFWRRNIRQLKLLGNPNNFSTVDPHPLLNLLVCWFQNSFFVVVSSKLSWVCTFENFMSGAECLIYHPGPSFHEVKMWFMGVQRWKIVSKPLCWYSCATKTTLNYILINLGYFEMVSMWALFGPETTVLYSSSIYCIILFLNIMYYTFFTVLYYTLLCFDRIQCTVF